MGIKYQTNIPIVQLDTHRQLKSVFNYISCIFFFQVEIILRNNAFLMIITVDIA